ncbi:MAG TPA: amidohydrolase [Clostridiales bacterium]|jgi:aminobenzoyl-glutamate utilization protein B|nr:amidohydrolase [Clostridiales bacterium]
MKNKINQAHANIDQNAQKLTEVSHKIWGYAELSLKEHLSAKALMDILQAEGFAIESNLCGMETAFLGSFGQGRPIIGILGEFDALAGLSQKATSIKKEPLVPGGNGHGCGHNMLGAGSLGAAIAVKEYLKNSGKEGTVIYYGCPGEESVGSKSYFARDKVWENLDAALTWHPSCVNEVQGWSSLSCIQHIYTFHGTSSHAAAAPEKGRSALDAVELMNIGIQFLREHMPDTARIHYAIIDTGGESPNVVQPQASVVYMVRDHQVHEALQLQKRVDAIAQGAALMTGTKVSIQFKDALSNTVLNDTLSKVMNDCLQGLEPIQYTEDEIDFAKSLIASLEHPPTGTPGTLSKHFPDIKKWVEEVSDSGKMPLNTFYMPYKQISYVMPGSTDVGDVSWQTPTAQANIVCYPAHTPGHSWQIVSCGASSIGDKGMIQAAKLLASTAITLFEKPELLAKAKKEFDQTLKGKYVCPVPEDAVPKPVN